jgi:hypothetical protein
VLRANTEDPVNQPTAEAAPTTAQPEATAVLDAAEMPAQPGPTPEPAVDAAANIVPVPVPAHLNQPKTGAPAAPPAGECLQEEELARQSSPPSLENELAAAAARGGLLRRVLGALLPKKRPPRAAQDGQELSEPGTEEQPGIVIAMADFVLRAVNRPFAFFSPGARQVVGLAAIVTLAIAAVTAALAPLMPRNDPLTFVRQKRAELDRPPPPPAPAAAPAHAGNAPEAKKPSSGH